MNMKYMVFMAPIVFLTGCIHLPEIKDYRDLRIGMTRHEAECVLKTSGSVVSVCEDKSGGVREVFEYKTYILWQPNPIIVQVEFVDDYLVGWKQIIRRYVGDNGQNNGFYGTCCG